MVARMVESDARRVSGCKGPHSWLPDTTIATVISPRGSHSRGPVTKATTYPQYSRQLVHDHVPGGLILEAESARDGSEGDGHIRWNFVVCGGVECEVWVRRGTRVGVKVRHGRRT
jgi:hypothetical protein